MKRGRPWYVLLLALYPVLFLYARNLHFVFISDFLISEAVALACLGVLWGGAWLMVRDWQRAALLAAFWILFLQCYQPVYSVAWKVDFLWWLASRGLILWLVAMAAGTVLLLRVKMVAPLLVKCLNLAAIILVAFPAFAVVRSEIRLHMAAPKPARVSATEARPEGLEGRDLPDIYHIVLDAYGREDVLKDIYGYDNSPFLDELRNLGFFVASNARSNYWKTDLSMPSVFNMSYLTYVDGEEGVLQTDSGLRGDSNLLIRKGRVLTFLEGLGYRTVAFSVGYPSVELRTADVYFDIRGKGLADLPTFQYQALLMTPLPAALDLLAPGFEALLCDEAEPDHEYLPTHR
jgi:hypothetical protein